mmetsp:Transcript_46753/g.54046  ORF Transcript_46753/g.54046 Transcript_46753/m.54046 type:complete len:215 (-) Transcript_46753:63-707(-)
MHSKLNYFSLSTVVAAFFIIGNVAVAAKTTHLRGGTTEGATRHNSRGLDANVNMSGGGSPDSELVESFDGDITEDMSSLPVPGICDTTGNWETVEGFSAYTPIIPGRTYNGLVWNTTAYYVTTKTWRECAQECNNQSKCILYSVYKEPTDTGFMCYLHDRYECNNGGDIKPPFGEGKKLTYEFGGVCRPMSEHGDIYDKSKVTQKPICSEYTYN